MGHDLQQAEAVEIDYWRTSPTESPGSESFENILNKLTDAPVFLEGLSRYRSHLADGHVILELGAGQGWASCLLTRLLGPKTRVIASDISRYALASLPLWKRLFGVSGVEGIACRSYGLPFASGSFDAVIAFQAAHHFRAQRRTLEEVARVLRVGGICLYLHEPACPGYMYPLARFRVNRKRPEVPEDVLVPSRLFRIARGCGLVASSDFDVSIIKRGPVELIYYTGLRLLPWLKHLVPCTRHLVFRKAGLG